MDVVMELDSLTLSGKTWLKKNIRDVYRFHNFHQFMCITSDYIK